MIPTPQVNPSLASQSSNILKRSFNKYVDLEEQKYSERCMIALRIMDILSRTNQCKIEEAQKIKDLVLYTKYNLNVSIFQLDMMVNPNDRLPYNVTKYHEKVFYKYVNQNRTQTEEVRYRVSDIQELLLMTMNDISTILNEVLLRNHLLNYWED